MMIRNPSDGTTYDPPKPSKEISIQANGITTNSLKTGSKEITLFATHGSPEIELSLT
jgi:exo-beta-1,3-glucanase (GH17 family)